MIVGRTRAAVGTAITYVAIWAALAVFSYAFLRGAGIAYNGDSIRDYFGGLAILDGHLPAQGPETGKLGFHLGLLYYHLVAAILAVSPSLQWIEAFICGWRALEPILFFVLVRRLASRPIALIAAAFYVGCDATRGIGHLFTHSAFMMPFELVGVLALEARLRGRPWALAAMLLALSAALQFHASSFPLLVFAAAASFLVGPNLAWLEVPWAWLAFLAPALPFYGDASFRALHAEHGAVAAFGRSLLANTALFPSLLAVMALARPKQLRSARGLGLLLVAIGAWGLFMLALTEMRGEVPVLRLFNLELHRPPVLLEDSGTFAATDSRWIWRFFQIFDTAAGIYALAAMGGLALVLRAGWGRTGTPAERRGARFTIAWLAVTGVFGIYANLRAPSSQPQYLVHMAPPIIVLIAYGLHAAGGLVATFAAARLPQRTGTGASIAAIVAAAVLGATVIGPSTLIAALAVAARLPRSPLTVIALVVPVALRLPHADLEARDPRDLAYDRVTSAVADYGFDDLGLGSDVRRRIHGGDEGTWWGEPESAWTVWMLTHADAAPDATRDGAIHYRLRSTADGSGNRQAIPVPGTTLLLEPYGSALQLDDATYMIPEQRQDTAPMPLPYRVSLLLAERAPERGLALFEPVQPVDKRAPLLRITIPRDPAGAEAGDAVRVLLREGPHLDPALPCTVQAAFDGALLVAESESTSRRRDLVFRLPRNAGRGSFALDLVGCYPDFLDIYDER